MKLLRLVPLALITLGALGSASAQSCLVETIAGDFQGPAPGDGGPADMADLVFPADVRQGPDGAVYISDSGHRVIRRVGGDDGIIRTFAGTGAKGFGGDGGPAGEAVLSEPLTMAFGPDGSLYFVDKYRIRRIGPDGMIHTVAGNGSAGAIEPGASAVDTPLGGALSLTVDAEGVVYLSSGSAHQVFRISSDGRISVFAGRSHFGVFGGFFDGDGGPATEALLNNPGDVVIDSSGVVYILDRGNARIWRVSPDGIIDTYVGGTYGYSPAGTPREQIALANVYVLQIDAQDRLYWADAPGIRRLPAGGVLETVVLLSASRPVAGLTVEPDSQIYFPDGKSLVFAVGESGAPEVFAGSGLTAPRGEAGPARNALIGSITGLATGSDGEVYYADGSFFRIRKIGPDGVMRRVAGTGDYSDPSEEGMPALASGAQPSGLALDSQGRVLYTEYRDRVWRIEPDGTLYRVAGQGVLTTRCPDLSCGDGGPAREATISQTEGVAADSLGNIFVGERRRSSPARWIRRIRPDGMIESLPLQDPRGNFYGPVTAFATTLDDELLTVLGDSSTASLWAFPPDGGREQQRPGWTGYFPASAAVAQHPNGDTYAPDDFGQRLYRLASDGRRHLLDPVFPDRDTPVGSGADEQLFGSVTSLAMTRDGDLIIGDDGDKMLLRIRNVADCPADDRPQVARSGLFNGASFRTYLAPGTVFSLFGQGLGPEGVVTAELAGGSFPTEIAGTRVLINGEPAALIFAAEGQVGGIVPWNAPIWRTLSREPTAPYGPVVDIVVEREGSRSTASTQALDEAAPAFFTADSSGGGLAAALNQDGSVNGPLRPAPLGSVIVLFGTGFGPFDSPQTDGALAQPPLARLVHEPKVKVGNEEAELLYAGPAPGLVSGVVQLNVRLPAAVDRPGAIEVSATVGDQETPTVQVVIGQ